MESVLKTIFDLPFPTMAFVFGILFIAGAYVGGLTSKYISWKEPPMRARAGLAALGLLCIIPAPLQFLYFGGGTNAFGVFDISANPHVSVREGRGYRIQNGNTIVELVCANVLVNPDHEVWLYLFPPDANAPGTAAKIHLGQMSRLAVAGRVYNILVKDMADVTAGPDSAELEITIEKAT